MLAVYLEHEDGLSSCDWGFKPDTDGNQMNDYKLFRYMIKFMGHCSGVLVLKILLRLTNT